MKKILIFIALFIIILFVFALIINSNRLESCEDYNKKVRKEAFESIKGSAQKDFDKVKGESINKIIIHVKGDELFTKYPISENSTSDIKEFKKDTSFGKGKVININKDLKELFTKYSLYNYDNELITFENLNLESLDSEYAYMRYLDYKIDDIKINIEYDKSNIFLKASCLYGANSIIIPCGSIVLISLKQEDVNKNVIWNQREYYSDAYAESQAANQMVDKPIIYIYPEEETELEIKLGREKEVTCIYPEYNNSWKVLAKPDGTLINQETGRKYYSLYYESNNIKNYQNQEVNEGFVVSRDQIEEFLEEKLNYLGLNDKESEEFIIYWLPKLKSYHYIYIRFQNMEEIENNMPLEFSKEPDTLIRVIMEWKGLESPIHVEKQNLEKVTRKGFTIVEWGGTEITD